MRVTIYRGPPGRVALARRQCRGCGRVVPVAPGSRATIVAHTYIRQGADFVPCRGDDSSMTSPDHARLVHPAYKLGRAYAVLACDALWEGL